MNVNLLRHERYHHEKRRRQQQKQRESWRQITSHKVINKTGQHQAATSSHCRMPLRRQWGKSKRKGSNLLCTQSKGVNWIINTLLGNRSKYFYSLEALGFCGFVWAKNKFSEFLELWTWMQRKTRWVTCQIRIIKQIKSEYNFTRLELKYEWIFCLFEHLIQFFLCGRGWVRF